LARVRGYRDSTLDISYSLPAATGLDVRPAAAAFEELIPLARHAAPAEVARAMLFLASDESSFVTGTTLAVDGGMSI